MWARPGPPLRGRGIRGNSRHLHAGGVGQVRNAVLLAAHRAWPSPSAPLARLLSSAASFTGLIFDALSVSVPCGNGITSEERPEPIVVALQWSRPMIMVRLEAACKGVSPLQGPASVSTQTKPAA